MPGLAHSGGMYRDTEPTTHRERELGTDYFDHYRAERLKRSSSTNSDLSAIRLTSLNFQRPPQDIFITAQRCWPSPTDPKLHHF